MLKETCLPERGFFSKINDSLPGSTGFHPVLRVDFCHSFRNKGITVPKIPPILRRINGTKKTPSIENNSMNFPPPLFCWCPRPLLLGIKKKTRDIPKNYTFCAGKRKKKPGFSFFLVHRPPHFHHWFIHPQAGENCRRACFLEDWIRRWSDSADVVGWFPNSVNPKPEVEKTQRTISFNTVQRRLNRASLYYQPQPKQCIVCYFRDFSGPSKWPIDLYGLIPP